MHLRQYLNMSRSINNGNDHKTCSHLIQTKIQRQTQPLQCQLDRAWLKAVWSQQWGEDKGHLQKLQQNQVLGHQEAMFCYPLAVSAQICSTALGFAFLLKAHRTHFVPHIILSVKAIHMTGSLPEITVISGDANDFYWLTVCGAVPSPATQHSLLSSKKKSPA